MKRADLKKGQVVEAAIGRAHCMAKVIDTRPGAIVTKTADGKQTVTYQERILKPNGYTVPNPAVLVEVTNMTYWSGKVTTELKAIRPGSLYPASAELQQRWKDRLAEAKQKARQRDAAERRLQLLRGDLKALGLDDNVSVYSSNRGPRYSITIDEKKVRSLRRRLDRRAAKP